MSDELLTEEVKTYVTPTMLADLQAVADARTKESGEKVRLTVIAREALRDFISKNKRKK